MALSELGAFLRRSAKALTHPQYLALLLGQPKGDLSEKPHQWEKAPSNRASEVGPEYLEQRLLWYQSGSEVTSALCSFSDALIQFSRDHLRGEAVAAHYVPYLLATLNHHSALRYQEAP